MNQNKRKTVAEEILDQMDEQERRKLLEGVPAEDRAFPFFPLAREKIEEAIQEAQKIGKDRMN